MKKYVKPTLFYESFELTQFVAGNCGFTVDFKDDACLIDAGFDADSLDILYEIYCWTNGVDNGKTQLLAS